MAKFLLSFLNRLESCHPRLHHFLHCKTRNLSPRVHSWGILAEHLLAECIHDSVGQRTEQVKTGQVNPDRPLVGPSVDTFADVSWDLSWAILEWLKTGKSTLVGALVGALVGTLVGPLAGQIALSYRNNLPIGCT